MTFKGENIYEMITQNPLFDSVMLCRNSMLERQVDNWFVTSSVALNLDPDVIKKQAKLIIELQETVDFLMNDVFRLGAPSYRTYCELENENEKLKSIIDDVRKLTDVF